MSVERVIKDLGIEVSMVVHDNYMCRCPWPENHTNGDRNPSFSIDEETGRWICFRGCGDGGGDLGRLVQLVLGVSEAEAVRWVKARAGTTGFDEVLAVMPGQQEVVEEPEDTLQAFRLDYNRQLTDKTSSYILKRGFTPETLRQWGFRYDPELRAVVVPVYDGGGTRLVGIIRRMVPPVRPGFPKYLYPPGFDKSKYLFGAHKHHSESGRIILVEGPLDAVWLHQSGYTEAVALMGVYCSKDQRRALSTLGSEVVLALDNDEAGREGMDRLVDQLRPRFNVMYSGLLASRKKDPQEHSKEELEEVFGQVSYGWEKGV